MTAEAVRRPSRTWSPSHALPAEQAADLGRLVEHVEAVADRVPCRSGTTLPTAAWTSDDLGWQKLAADACLDCPVFWQCRSYALRWASRLTDAQQVGAGAGGAVYGGMTARALKATTRPPRTGREGAESGSPPEHLTQTRAPATEAHTTEKEQRA